MRKLNFTKIKAFVQGHIADECKSHDFMEINGIVMQQLKLHRRV